MENVVDAALVLFVCAFTTHTIKIRVIDVSQTEKKALRADYKYEGR